MTFLPSPGKVISEVRSGRIVKWSPMERRRAILKTLTRKRTRGKNKRRGKQTLISASNLSCALLSGGLASWNWTVILILLFLGEGWKGALPGTSALSYPLLSIPPACTEKAFQKWCCDIHGALQCACELAGNPALLRGAHGVQVWSWGSWASLTHHLFKDAYRGGGLRRAEVCACLKGVMEQLKPACPDNVRGFRLLGEAVPVSSSSPPSFTVEAFPTVQCLILGGQHFRNCRVTLHVAMCSTPNLKQGEMICCSCKWTGLFDFDYLLDQVILIVSVAPDAVVTKKSSCAECFI